jgi:hypothetical protein
LLQCLNAWIDRYGSFRSTVLSSLHLPSATQNGILFLFLSRRRWRSEFERLNAGQIYG